MEEDGFCPEGTQNSTVCLISFSVDMPVKQTRALPVAAMARINSWLVRSAEATL